MKRLNYLDFIKGLAILFVVFGHIPHLENDFFVMWIYSFHIPLFFIVSGYLIQYKKKKLNLKKIAGDLLYPYIVFSVLSIAFCFLFGLVMHSNYIDLPTAILKTVCLDGFSTLWFLPALFLAELLFYNIRKLFGKKEKWIYVMLMILTSLASYYLDVSNYILVNVLNRALIGSIFVYFGTLACDVCEKKSSALCFASILIILINIYISNINGTVDLHFSKLNNPILYYYLAISTSLTIIYLIKYLYNKFNLNLKFMQYLGNNSLVIMATHLPFLILGTIYNILTLNNELFRRLIVFLIVIIIELVLIFVIKKYMKFIIDINFFKNRKEE